MSRKRKIKKKLGRPKVYEGERTLVRIPKVLRKRFDAWLKRAMKTLEVKNAE